MLRMLRNHLKRCSVMLSASSLRTRASTRSTLKKHRWWVTKMTIENFTAWPPSSRRSLSPLPFVLFFFVFPSNNELAITLRDCGLISPLISRGDIHHGIISKLLAGYWSGVTIVSPFQLISSVWSPQSIEFSLQQFCLPFLRLSCLLQHHLYGDSLTGCLVCFIITTLLYPCSKNSQYLCSSCAHCC